MTKTDQAKTSKSVKNDNSSEEPVCFIISPIGGEGTEKFNKFKEVLEFLIKPAVKSSGYTFRVIRADDIERAGSFIKDILTSLLDSFVVIADLTEQNPNVFYELGVRHALSPRTILIAQSVDAIPSDLREYRTIVYDTTLPGAASFSKRLTGYLRQIYEEPHRPDNPVLDRLQSIIEEKTNQLEAENADLKKQINNILKKGVSTEPKQNNEEHVSVRIERILKVYMAERQYLGNFTRTKDGETERFKLPASEGKFELYFLVKDDSIMETWYVSTFESIPDFEKVLAHVRVLLELCSKEQNMAITFIIATNKDLSKEKTVINKTFNQMKRFVSAEYRNLFSLEVWDEKGLLKVDQELGIKIDLKLLQKG